MTKRRIGSWTLAIVVLVAVAQLVPYGHNHTNPPVSAEPRWDSPRTRDLAVRACFDCHSNNTTWPWYTNVAPVSWLTQADVEVGRARLNFSTWDKPQERAREASQQVQRGSMPPIYYVPLHPTASLSAAEKELLAQGLQKTVESATPPVGAVSGREGRLD